MAIQLKKAQRKRVKLKIGLSAPSGGGKTASALILAYGLLKGEHPDWSDEEIWSHIALIDTENGSGELYAGVTIGGTHIGEYTKGWFYVAGMRTNLRFLKRNGRITRKKLPKKCKSSSTPRWRTTSFSTITSSNAVKRMAVG